MNDTRLRELNETIESFHLRLLAFASENGMTINYEINKNKDKGNHWYTYSINIRKDLFPFDLSLNEDNGILSYCTDFNDGPLNIKQATFGGHKRLVVWPDSIEHEIVVNNPNNWFFISKNSDVERFLGFLLHCKYNVRNFA